MIIPGVKENGPSAGLSYSLSLVYSRKWEVKTSPTRVEDKEKFLPEGRGEFSRPGIIYKFLYLKKRVCLMKKVRVHLLIKGRVQGVFFRATLRDLALRLGINGWVRNLWGSGVEAVLEGEEKQVKEVIDWSHQGPPGARVDEVEVDWEKYQGKFKSFSIRY